MISRYFKLTGKSLVVLPWMACALVIGITPKASAQAQAAPTVAITFKTDKPVAASTLRRAGDNIMATVPATRNPAEIAYPISEITNIDFPKPAQIKIATDLIAQGKPADAITSLDPIINYYAQFKDVPGSWWAKSTKLKVQALLALKRDADAEVLMNEMVKGATADIEPVNQARVLVAAGWAKKGQHQKAIDVYNEVTKTSNDSDTLSIAWFNKANSLFVLQDFDPALLAYLHIPVFYSEDKTLMPQAMLGSARCYVRIEDLPGAEKAFNELIEQFPSSPEATTAKAELKKISKNLPQATATPANQ